jgi:hypothetical protein
MSAQPEFELRVLPAAERAHSHPDCARCQQIERERFKPSSLCGNRCDCTSYCEEYARYVMTSRVIVPRKP